MRYDNVNALMIDYYWSDRLNEDDIFNLSDVEFIRFVLYQEEFLKTYQEKKDYRKFLAFINSQKNLINQLKEK